ncbi:MAG: beta-galactosidase [Firmicutes bacterium]|nr:beta-galactosidase [Bacillota bacterium]
MKNTLWSRLGSLAYGGDYNPEQWPEETWLEDIALMREARVNLVSVGIFSWANLQYGPDEWHFEWLDKILNLLHDNEIFVLLATATASPPPWLTAQHPEILPVTRDGIRLSPGSRQHYCPSSPEYRAWAERLVDTLAHRYGSHPAVVGWHVGNEYGCHVSQCYCDISAEDFRRWLKARYGSLDELNRAWSTAFWSQRYQDWAEILPPRVAPTFINPAQQLDFQRFSSDALLECFRREAAVLKRVSPDKPITTNFMGLFKPLDYFRWAAEEDFVSHDSYPDPADDTSPISAALVFDFMRSARRGEPWLLMEQAPSGVNWRPHNVPKGDGQYRLWSYQALAHGANGIMNFQWRASRGGAEKFHSGMVPHAGRDTRIFRNVAMLGQELSRLTDLLDSRVTADVAIVLDWASWWALELDSHPSQRLSLLNQLFQVYQTFWRHHVSVDIVEPSSDLSSYRLVVAPNLYLLSKGASDRLTHYVQSGGELVILYFSSVVDENDIVFANGAPGPLSDVLGLSVEEFWPLPDDVTVDVQGENGFRAAASVWAELIRLKGAESWAAFASGPLHGHPAIARHRYGKGRAWYVGAHLMDDGMTTLLTTVMTLVGIKPVGENIPTGVEATIRRGTHHDYLFLLNHLPNEAWIALDSRWLNNARVLDGRLGEGGLSLSPRGVAILTSSG